MYKDRWTFCLDLIFFLLHKIGSCLTLFLCCYVITHPLWAPEVQKRSDILATSVLPKETLKNTKLPVSTPKKIDEHTPPPPHTHTPLWLEQSLNLKILIFW